MARVLRLPARGTLIVCTDLQGCLRDFHRIVEIFDDEMAAGGDAHLLFTGDLIHGPHLDPEDWPDFLGEYYRDASGELIDELVVLSRAHPGRIHALVGNHEHGHIGGPHTAKFAADEVVVLEQQLGPARAEHLREVLREFALVAVAPCGAIFTHGAPAATVQSIADIERASLDGFDYGSPIDILDTPVIGPILWARAAEPDVARRFVRALGGTFCIYGHDVIPEGFEMVGDEQMVVSTSFGVFDARKVYVRLDLAARYRTVRELRFGKEILPLYPELAEAVG
ncbi:MAG TPA: metallophosphoesterase [Kofleriaceae bacterium]|nr:metallophosphoesterase [Kofleriaceae bacterium]